VALLEFLAAPAMAGVVTANLRTGTDLGKLRRWGLLCEVDLSRRRHTESEHGVPVQVRDRQVALRHDIHADQHIEARELTDASTDG
jgi:hypothetical protein